MSNGDSVEGELVNHETNVKLTKHPERIVAMLEAAFNNGFNISEACQYAEISRTIYYEWLADDDLFSYRMSVAQSAPQRKAKQNVIAAIAQGDPSISLRFLMLRDPDFKPKMQNETSPEVAETRNNLKEVLHAISKHDPSSEPSAPDSSNDPGVVADSPTDIS